MITKKYYKLIRVSYADEGYFCLTNVSNSIGSVKIDIQWGSGNYNPNYEYSTDGVTWNTYNVKGTEVQVDPNSNIYWRYAGSGNTIDMHLQNIYFGFFFDFDCYASGNFMSLFSKTDFANYTGSWCAKRCFGNQSHLIKADFNFGSITSIPDDNLYQTFWNCTSLTSVPDFSNITSIGTQNSSGGMESAFEGCTSLTTGPNLTGITSVGNRGLMNTFKGSSSLSTVYAPTITWDIDKTSAWLYGVAASGTLYADASIASTIPTNASGCPRNWTVVTL